MSEFEAVERYKASLMVTGFPSSLFTEVIVTSREAEKPPGYPARKGGAAVINTLALLPASNQRCGVGFEPNCRESLEIAAVTFLG